MSDEHEQNRDFKHESRYFKLETLNSKPETNLTPDGNTALLLIDVQLGIDEEAHWGGNRNNRDAENNIARLLHVWRSNNLPVIIVQHNSVSPASPFRPGAPGNALKAFVTVLPGETLIEKATTSAFVNTGLREHLTRHNIRQLVIVGFVTNNSVEATARMAGDMGFVNVVVSDATATFDKRGVDGKRYTSELMHTLALSNLAGEYASIHTTAETIALFTSSTKSIAST